MAKEKAPIPTAAPAEDKKRAIEAAMGQIEKMYGKGSIMRLGDQNNLQVDVIPTGSLSLDVALGVGGLPRGRIVEIYGPDPCPPCGGGGPEKGRRGCLCGRRARAGPHLCPGAGREY